MTVRQNILANIPVYNHAKEPLYSCCSSCGLDQSSGAALFTVYFIFSGYSGRYAFSNILLFEDLTTEYVHLSILLHTGLMEGIKIKEQPMYRLCKHVIFFVKKKQTKKTKN